MTTASFPSMTLTQLNSLLDGIENDDETLVYTQQIAFELARGASGLQVGAYDVHPGGVAEKRPH